MENIKRIDEERYTDMLEVLPPCKWEFHGNDEAFYLSEHLRDDTVLWLVRLGSFHFSGEGSCNLRTTQVIAEVAHYVNEKTL